MAAKYIDTYTAQDLLSSKELELRSANNQHLNGERIWKELTILCCWTLRFLVFTGIVIVLIAVYDNLYDSDKLMSGVLCVGSNVAAFIIGKFLKIK